MNLKNNQRGMAAGIALTVCLLLLVGSIIFGVWAFTGQQNYKNNTQAIVDKKVKVAQQAIQAKDLADYNEKLKNPYKNYIGPVGAGSINLTYPNTWNAYVDDTGISGTLVNAYFDPVYIPPLNNQNSVFSLQVQVIAQPYSQVIQNLQSSKKAKTIAYSLPKLPGVVGVYVSGDIGNQKTGYEVVLPLRNYTIEITTYGNNYKSDFDNIILKNFSFIP
jgi:hypothetical protein